MPKDQRDAIALYDLPDDANVDINDACLVVGGPRTPIDRSTYLREAKAGRLPPLIAVTPNNKRTTMGALRAALAARRDS